MKEFVLLWNRGFWSRKGSYMYMVYISRFQRQAKDRHKRRSMAKKRSSEIFGVTIQNFVPDIFFSSPQTRRQVFANGLQRGKRRHLGHQWIRISVSMEGGGFDGPINAKTVLVIAVLARWTKRSCRSSECREQKRSGWGLWADKVTIRSPGSLTNTIPVD